MTVNTADYAASKKYVAEIAAGYDAGRMNRPNWQWEQDQVEAWVKTLTRGSSILDVPIGTGRYVPFYQSRGLQITGLDRSGDMIAEAEKKYPNAFEAQVGEAEHLPYPDAAFDAVLSGRFIQWLPSLDIVDRVLAEFARVARSELLLQLNIPAGQARKIEPLPVRIRKWAGKPFKSLDRLWRRITKHPSMDIKTTFHREPDVLERAERHGWVLVEIGRECPSSPGVRFYRFRKG